MPSVSTKTNRVLRLSPKTSGKSDGIAPSQIMPTQAQGYWSSPLATSPAETLAATDPGVQNSTLYS